MAACFVRVELDKREATVSLHTDFGEVADRLEKRDEVRLGTIGAQDCQHRQWSYHDGVCWTTDSYDKAHPEVDRCRSLPAPPGRGEATAPAAAP